MTLVISKGITLRKGYIGTDDPDAEAYITAVEAADEAESPGVGSLETATKVAIHSFVKGCKNDGIWPAIKASCILAGARTLTGALVPLVGTAPTNVNFVSGDYNRKTGLVGDGSTKYLNSNRNNNADPQNSSHCSAFFGTNYVATLANSAILGAGGGTTGSNQIQVGAGSSLPVFRNRSTSFVGRTNPASFSGLIGLSRANSSNFTARFNGSNFTDAIASETPFNGNILVFARNSSTLEPGLFSNSRLAFYSIGESLDLALLDARVTDLINAFAAAIP
jgi:hypothetical protein